MQTNNQSNTEEKNNEIDFIQEQFFKYVNKIVFVELKSGRKYEDIRFLSISNLQSPVRFLNFENLRDERTLCFVPEEIKRIEVIR